MKSLVKDYVDVAPRFTRSVNINSDINRDNNEYGYIITSNVKSALSQVITGLSSKKGQKSFSLFGLYGSGKSAFAVYLSQLLSPNKSISTHAISHLKSNALDPKLMKFLTDRKTSAHLPILVTGRRRPINQLIMEGILNAAQQLSTNSKAKELVEISQAHLKNESWKDTAEVIRCLDLMGELAKIESFAGLALIIDEAGKTLEYALSDREGGDVYIYQQIAEHAERLSKYSMLFMITLHQQMDSYSELLSRTNRAEWVKIQERFENLRFAEPASSTILMLSEAIKPIKDAPPEVSRALDKSISEIEGMEGMIPNGLSTDSFRTCSHKAWPIHPSLLLALPHIFKRFAQNERSIFSYLISEEYSGFQSSIRTKEVGEDDGFIRIKDIYDYLISNYEIGLSRNPHSKKLLEANDVLNSRSRLSDRENDTIKTIAVLNAVSEISPLRATKEMLNTSLPIFYDTNTILDSLMSQSLITFRKLDYSYRVWEGSDVDLDDRLKEARRHLHYDTQLFLDTIGKHLKQKRMVARRHSLDVGIIRYFSIVYTDRFADAESLLQAELADGAAGLVLVMIPGDQFPNLTVNAEQLSKAHPQLIIAIPKQMDSLSGIVNELASLKWVEEHTDELRDDRIARRELNMRISSYEQELAKRAQAIIDPRPAPKGNSCIWYWMGNNQGVANPVEISKLLSRACDVLFHKSPVLRNELISRDDISNAASAARRALMEKVITSAEKETLGMSGFPPERSIYESILKAAEIHVFDEIRRCWKFQAPPNSNFIKLRPAWQLMEKTVFNANLEQIELFDMYASLKQTPYGLPEGVFPLLFTAFYVVYQNEIFLYREGSFLPDPQPGHFDLLQRRIDLFAVKGIRLSGIRLQIIERLAKSLNTEAKIATVVRALFRYINSLPELSKRSKKIEDRTARQMRDAFLSATAPEDLIFKDLPNCFELPRFNTGKLTDSDLESYFDKLNSSLQTLMNFAPMVMLQARNQLLTCCGLAADDSGWIELENRCNVLSIKIRHEVLTPFINSVLNGIRDKHSPIPALSNVSTRSFEQWSDMDIERFNGLAEGLGELFQYYWHNFGERDQEVLGAEQNEIDVLRNEIETKIMQLKKTGSVSLLKKFLQEMLIEIEKESDSQEKG
ncbi:MAG: hypothetical protein PHY48_04860 [Candidatus Cloacimonetes bacterium]|jgi:hypothetical protein|nr:hypothetical protein [Candidatus Cloacimonadota bacterium]